MGFSELPGRYPVDPDLQGILERRRENRTDLQGSPLVVVLAQAFIEEGSSGFRELMGALAIKIDPDQDFFPQIPAESETLLRIHHALIVFGISVASIHEILAHKEFNAPVWCERYNVAVVGTQIPHAHTEGKRVEQLSNEDWGNMCRQARQDSSFASFFTTHFDLLPEALKDVIKNSNTRPFIQDVILPLYKERAQVLLSPQA